MTHARVGNNDVVSGLPKSIVSSMCTAVSHTSIEYWTILNIDLKLFPYKVYMTQKKLFYVIVGECQPEVRRRSPMPQL